VAKNSKLGNAYGQHVAAVVAHIVKEKGYDKVVATSSSFGKDVLPRAGGLLDVQPISDVLAIEDNGNKFVRPVYANNAICTVSSSDKIKMLAIRPTNFEKTKAGEGSASVEDIDVSSVLGEENGKWIENIVTESEVADLGQAKFVVAGGRGLKNGENFKMLYDLAKVIGGPNCAVGASRAAVDAGYVPNDLQIG
jgi:electron transfer flavoprotein alpha subunit